MAQLLFQICFDVAEHHVGDLAERYHDFFVHGRIFLHEHGRGKLACKPIGARDKAVARVVSSESDRRDNAFHCRATIGNFPEGRVQHGREDLLAGFPRL